MSDLVSLPHVMPADAVAERLGVAPSEGHSPASAAEILAAHGPNELIGGERKHPVLILLAQFTSPLIIVLIGAAIISALVSDLKDAIVIGVILVLNGVVGFIQEYRADQAMAALKKLSVPKIVVRRGGSPAEISATDVVPGDIVLVEAGVLIPCDGRVAVSAQLRVDESALTGESVPVDKISGTLDEAALPLGDRTNMLFKGTAVVYGRGEFIATATGMATELGKIASSLSETREAVTPLQRRLSQLGKWLALGALIICAIIFALGMIRGEAFESMLMTAIALAVAAIPEGLPAVVTIALALGARRMAQQRAIVRSLPAVEGLGSVTTICSDKTGTLTRNEMTVTDIMTGSGEWRVTGSGCEPTGSILPAEGSGDVGLPDSLIRLLRAGLLCNDASVEMTQGEDGPVCKAVGDPTEAALVSLAMKAGLSPADLRAQAPRLAENPFDSDSKRMATLHEIEGEQVVYVKGAPEAMLDACAAMVRGGGVATAHDELCDQVRHWIDELASHGRRTLAIAEKRVSAMSDIPDDVLDDGLTLLGVVGIIDPARAEAKAAIAECQTAGVRTVMITGDHKLTARAVADDLGLLRDGSEAMDGPELDATSDEELTRRVEHVAVYARVSPEHKLRIVRALQNRGEIVSMTGDGVNDGPALRTADIGVAMGQTGTDVAREASSLVLADDNFATIVAAVREGRVIYDNLRKFLRFMLTTNLAEVFTILVAMLLGWPVPLLALQILFLNLVTDGLPALALGVEPPERDVMRRPPRSPREGIFSGGMLQSIVIGSALMTALVILAMRSGEDLEHQRTIAFTALAFAQMANCLAVRSERDLVFRVGLFTNRSLLGAVALTIVAQLLVVYVPVLQGIFRTVALSAADMSLCVGTAALVFLGVELEKLIRSRISPAM